MQYPQNQTCNPWNSQSGCYTGCGQTMPIVPGSNPALQTWNGQNFVVADGSNANPIKLPFLKINQGNASYLIGSDNNGVLSYYNSTPSLATNINGGSAGNIVYQSGASTTSFVASGTSGQILQSNGTSSPNWITSVPLATNINGGIAGEIPYQTASGTTAFTSVGTNGQVLTSSGGGTPVWANAPAATTAQAIANGSAGQIVYQSGSSSTSFVSTGTSGQVLVSNGTSTPFWSTNISGNAATATTANVANSVASASVTSAGLASDVGSNTWVVKYSNYTALAGDRVATSTSGGAWTLTLPTSPTTNTMVTIADNDHYWSTHNLTVAPGGSNTIEGSVQNLICNVSGYSIYVLYNGTTWRVLV